MALKLLLLYYYYYILLLLYYYYYILLLLYIIITFLGVGGVSRAIQQRITFCMYTDIYNVQEKSVISSASMF